MHSEKHPGWDQKHGCPRVVWHNMVSAAQNMSITQHAKSFLRNWILQFSSEIIIPGWGITVVSHSEDQDFNMLVWVGMYMCIRLMCMQVCYVHGVQATTLIAFLRNLSSFLRQGFSWTWNLHECISWLAIKPLGSVFLSLPVLAFLTGTAKPYVYFCMVCGCHTAALMPIWWAFSDHTTQ